MTRVQTQQALRQLPIKWALALLALIVVYSFAQPALNNRFGWNLPSLAKLMGEREPKKVETDDSHDTKSKSSKSSSASASSKTSPPADDSDDRLVSATEVVDEPSTAAEPTLPTAPPKSKSSSESTESKKPTQPTSQPKSKPTDSTLLYGILKETGRERYVSVEGLQYNPGSEEGHRLKHLERHLQDMPDRPGKHGVFDGEMKDALRWIDDAYARGKRGAKGVRKSEEEGRTVYEVPFTQPIGYIGGRDGKRSGNPPAKRLRLVVEGSKFVTAFPF